MRSRYRPSVGLIRRWTTRVVSAIVLILAAAPSDAAGAVARQVMTTQGFVDPGCNGGKGVAIAAPPSWLAGSPSLTTAMMPSGVTLVIVSSGFPAYPYAAVHAFTATCLPDPDFGHNGTELLRFGGRAFRIAAAVAAVGGGAILAGRTAKGWLVGRVDAGGGLDPRFGKGGWSVLPWPGGASAVAQTPSGNIVLGGSLGGGCCEQEWVGEVNARGTPVRAFGSGGRARVPEYLEDTSVTRVAIEPSGEVLALSVGGHMGVWGTTVTAFTATGSLVPSFRHNFDAVPDRSASFTCTRSTTMPLSPGGPGLACRQLV